MASLCDSRVDEGAFRPREIEDEDKGCLVFARPANTTVFDAGAGIGRAGRQDIDDRAASVDGVSSRVGHEVHVLFDPLRRDGRL